MNALGGREMWISGFSFARRLGAGQSPVERSEFKYAIDAHPSQDMEKMDIKSEKFTSTSGDTDLREYQILKRLTKKRVRKKW